MNNQIKKIYYAHFIGIYDTKQEKRDMELIDKLFPNSIIVNPNSQEIKKEFEQYKLKNKENEMNFFSNLVLTCDILVFRGCVNGKIPAGVYKEIETANKNNMLVIELPSFIDRKMSVEDTRQMLSELGIR